MTKEWEQELKSMPFFSKVRIQFLSNCIFRKKEKWLICSNRRPKSGSLKEKERHIMLIKYFKG